LPSRWRAAPAAQRSADNWLKDRVEALGGRSWLESPPGAGISLEAELPLDDSLGSD